MNQTLQAWLLPLQDSPYMVASPAISEKSDTTAFDMGINQRDLYFSAACCVICGHSDDLDHAHIIPRVEKNTVSINFSFK